MKDAPAELREFVLALDSITMSERRIMASKFGVNWDAIEVDLSEVPRPEDPAHPTEAEKFAVAKAFTRIIGPNERFAALYIAVKRQMPAASVTEIEKRADSGEWGLALGSNDNDDVEADAVPLAPPVPPTDPS